MLKFLARTNLTSFLKNAKEVSQVRVSVKFRVVIALVLLQIPALQLKKYEELNPGNALARTPINRFPAEMTKER